MADDGIGLDKMLIINIIIEALINAIIILATSSKLAL